jgi:hypothetical protein
LTLVFTTVAGVAAVVALLYAHIACRGARRSNSIAADARQLAEEANEIATRAESREIERHDVYWDGYWETPGTYLLVKRGGDEAHDVKATVSVDGGRARSNRRIDNQRRVHIDVHVPSRGGRVRQRGR